MEHQSFLDTSGEDPMRPFAESLIKALGRSGPIYVYNQDFEQGRVKELAARYADLAPALEAIAARFFDLLPLTREHYCHPAMKGSWSIKAVLPTIAPDLDYAGLEDVQHGGQAQAAYQEIIAQSTPDERRNRLIKSLLAYCERDTEAMVRLAEYLQKCNRH